jgi:hypothetical protein
VRDYETVKVEQDVLNEYLLLFDDGESGTGPRANLERRPKGAYYKNIERKMLLKKKRTNVRFWTTFEGLEWRLITLHFRYMKLIKTSGRSSS